jgi:hypothetical protein
MMHFLCREKSVEEDGNKKESSKPDNVFFSMRRHLALQTEKGSLS